MPVPGGAAAVVVFLDFRSGKRAEDPYVACRGESLVFTLRLRTMRLLPLATVIGAEPA